MANFKDLTDQLCDKLKLDRADSSRDILKTRINRAYQEIANVTMVDWNALKRYGEIPLTANYVTGTCTTITGSRTVTFTGSNVLGMVGYFFQPSNSSSWYLINNVVDNATITLLSPIQEAGGSFTFTIWKRFYTLPSEVKKITKIQSWINDGMIEIWSPNKFEQNTINPSLTGDPSDAIIYGQDPFLVDYTEGTVTLSNNSNVATGTGTLFLANVTPGDMLIAASKTYRVKRVVSDTSLLLLNNATADVSVGVNYTIRKEGNIILQIYSNTTRNRILPFFYVKRVYDMVGDNDLHEFPPEFEEAILDGALVSSYDTLNDSRYAQTIQRYSARINDLKASRFVSEPKSRQMSPRITQRGSYINNWSHF